MILLNTSLDRHLTGNAEQNDSHHTSYRKGADNLSRSGRAVSSEATITCTRPILS
jgi:hypothetical protein